MYVKCKMYVKPQQTGIRLGLKYFDVSFIRDNVLKEIIRYIKQTMNMRQGTVLCLTTKERDREPSGTTEKVPLIKLICTYYKIRPIHNWIVMAKKAKIAGYNVNNAENGKGRGYQGCYPLKIYRDRREFRLGGHA